MGWNDGTKNAKSIRRNAMNTLSETVQTKLQELCRSILAEPAFEGARLRVEKFLIDDAARAQYVRVSEQGEHLHHKQTQGVELADAEVAEFEKQREVLLQNPVARGFLDAQEELQELQQSINKFISKTLELGRLPEMEEVSGGSCGSGCGCHGSH